ncbi:ATP phosphoribosyltransferase [Marinilongibacter aquaticus]|uniref:ATP phosphoribosyltransferase n=1 Tax=Marinilongibacter aquaticus TaxID=2975157 RepID=UPI0021BD5703|nr:ATP phosphoribosyltransferase [Marinilongibacter aquaticus]UBM59445.1 ATP phosphoribosyltransferase [Marinilongibacter aquaticus]
MNKLKIAIQKSGRLSDDSVKLFKECGIKFEVGKSKLKSTSRNFPADFLFLRDDDIPGYVEDGVADLGIVGKNVLVEYGNDVESIKELGFSKCRLSLAVPREVEYPGVEYFQGKSIATSYPNLLGQYLKGKGVDAHVHQISGSVEIAPGIGLAEGVCDIVSTGGTLLSNGLKEVETIFKSEAVLIANNKLSDEKKELLEKLLFRINAVQTAQNHKYVLLNAPNDKLQQIIELMPGMRSPTITPLAQEGWSSIHSVIKESDFWENIETLRKWGAEGILVIPIEKMIS